MVGYENHYQVSSLGRVKRTAPATGARIGRILKPAAMTSGYLFVVLSVESVTKAFSIHRIVAAAFIGPCPDRHDVNHKNGDRHDNRVENLEYMTRSQNIRHGMQFPRKHTSLRGDMLPNAKLNEEKVRDIKLRLARGEQQSEIAVRYGVKRTTIWRVAHGIQWNWVKPP